MGTPKEKSNLDMLYLFSSQHLDTREMEKESVVDASPSRIRSSASPPLGLLFSFVGRERDHH
jgi:hypothetical protein